MKRYSHEHGLEDIERNSALGRVGRRLQSLTVLQKVAGLVGAGAVGLAVVMIARSSSAMRARPYPGPGRTAVIGDSIVAHPTGFVQYLDRSVPGRSFRNFGVVGQGTAAIRRDLRNRVIGQGFDEVVIEGGINDFGRPNTLEYVTGNLRGMVQEAKAAGLKVVLLTMTPYYRDTAKIAQGNAIILREGRGWGADVVVDTHSGLKTLGGEIRSEYSAPDRIHLNREGQLVMGRQIQAMAYAQ